MKKITEIKTVMVVSKHLIYGGMERYTLNLVNALAERGIEVILITGDGPLAQEISTKVKVFFTPISRKNRWKQVSERKILNLAKKYKPQFIHAQCRTSMVCSQLARNTLDLPVIDHEHHIYEQYEYPFVMKELTEFADKIITIGPYTTKELTKRGMERKKIETVINGVEVKNYLPITEQEKKAARKYFKLNKSDNVVLCLSRVVHGKGVDKLVTAFITISKLIPNAKLVIGGDDEENYTENIKKIIKENNLQDKVFIYPGSYDIRKFHAVADIFCYPAICKGMAVMEAMAAGLPVVGRKTVRKPLVIEDNVSGLMVEETAAFRIDPDKIAEKLIYLLQRPELAQKMGEAGRKRVTEKFNLEKHISKILKVYRKIISDRQISRNNIIEYPDVELLFAVENQ